MIEIKNINLYFTFKIIYTTEEGASEHECREKDELVDFLNWLIKNNYKVINIFVNHRYN